MKLLASCCPLLAVLMDGCPGYAFEDQQGRPYSLLTMPSLQGEQLVTDLWSLH